MSGSVAVIELVAFVMMNPSGSFSSTWGLLRGWTWNKDYEISNERKIIEELMFTCEE